MKNKSKQSQKSPLYIILLGAGLLVLAGLLYWGLSSSRTTVTNTPVQATEPLTDADVERISVSDAKAAFDSETALFVDTRDLDSFNQGHIPGAVLITSTQVESKLSELDASVPVITYCT
jgi:3-mercaptopyruvate sulfurtransferase SseA